MSYDYKDYWGHATYTAGFNPDWIGIIQKHLAPGSVLDVGCGTGRFVDAFKDREYVGMDISPDNINQARQNYSGKFFMVADLVEKEMNPGVDNVFTWTVLEHIPPELIGGVIEKLKTWGKNVLIIEPIGSGPTAEHCFLHDYEKMGFKQIEDLESVKMFQWQRKEPAC